MDRLDDPSRLARRQFLQDCPIGLGGMALWSLLGDRAGADAPANPLAPRRPHFAPKAKRIIYLFMAGGPSQLELFEDKPALRRLDGQSPPASLVQGRRFAFLPPTAKL